MYYFILLGSGPQFTYPDFYTNDTNISRNNLYTGLQQKMSALPALNSEIRFPIYKAEEKIIEPDDIIAFEGLQLGQQVPGVTQLISYISKDNTRFLQVKKGEPDVWAFFFTKGSAYGKVACGAEPPDFILGWYGLTKNDVLVDLIKQGTESCELQIYQKLDNSRLIAKNYQPLCKISINKSEIRKLECLNTYYKVNEVLGNYKITSPYSAFVHVGSNDLSYGLVVFNDVVCEDEDCDIASSANFTKVPSDMRISTADTSYVPVIQNKTLLLMPHHRILTEGSVSTIGADRKKTTIPVRYTIIIPAIDFSYFVKK